MWVTCALAILLLSGEQAYPVLDGQLVQTKGDYWVVNFRQALIEKNLKTEKQIITVHSNRCLLK
jgi:hypothetical protein